MMDQQIAFAKTLGFFLHWMAENGYDWTMGDAWRSTDELACSHCGRMVTYQGLLVYNKRSKTQQSLHTQRRAVDIILVKDGQPVWDGEAYTPLGEKWELLGGKWGGHFKSFPDYGHFEL